jgi:hypothetical protein
MTLFAHHARGIIDLEVMGYDLTPDGMTEHVIAFAIAAVLLALLSYGAYAAVRDFLGWRRRRVAAR